MKKLSTIVLLMFLGAAMVWAQTPQDGYYFAQEADFVSGMKNQVVLKVQGGKIAEANWNVISYQSQTPDLKAVAARGVANAANWASQAKKAEDFLVSSQNTSATRVEGVTTQVAPFFSLVRAALQAGPVPRGAYAKDGWFYGEDTKLDANETRNTVLITIVNGTIKDVLWNGQLQLRRMDGINPSKIITSMAGQYPMPSTPRGPWHEQVKKAAAALVSVQDPAKIPLKADGKTDAITGVSIIVKEYLDVANTALRAAR
jgi:major membrane immunogen (membrane-anchored lipoprotein)